MARENAQHWEQSTVGLGQEVNLFQLRLLGHGVKETYKLKQNYVAL